MSRLGQTIRCMAAAAIVLFSEEAYSAPEYVEGEVLVTFKPSETLDATKRTLAVHSMEMARHFAFLSGRRGRHTGLARGLGRRTAALIQELQREPSVETAEPNFLRWPTAQPPNDSLFPRQWGLQNTGQPVNGFSGTTGADTRFLQAWTLARKSSSNVVVALIDTGVDYRHPDLAGNMWTNPGEAPGNHLDDDQNGYIDDYYGWDFADHIPDPSDSDIHGTHVAGTIAALGNNQMGVIGIDFQAKIMALKASSNGSNLTDSAIIEAIQYATMMKGRGVNIAAINASFGGPGFDSAMLGAIQSAGDAGIVFCAAAGNDSSDNDLTATYPAAYRLPNMIVVAATDQNDALASFSNHGATTVDLGAPGVNILSTTPTNKPGLTSYVKQGSTTYAANVVTYSGIAAGLTATIYDCGLGYPSNFPAAVNGNIALLSRGTIFFSDKAANAKAAGARAAIVYNNGSGNFSGTLGSPSNWIPVVSIAQADGLAIKASLPASGTVANFPDPAKIYQFLDGTSMATPHVSGAVAFAAMNFPDENVSQRIQRVLASVDLVPGLQGKVASGGRLNLQRIVDRDGNQLPDWWEQAYFGHLTGTDPNDDADLDGASNLGEWLAGTDPTNPNSSLRLISVTSGPGSGTILRWASEPGKYYRLERATNLLAGFTTVVRTNIAATTPINSEPDPAPLPPGSKRFYRVRLEY